MKGLIVTAAFLACFVTARLSIPNAHSATHETKQQKLMEAAKKEIELNILATWPPVEEKAIFEGFKRAYPFIKVRHTRMSGREGFERVRAEFASGRRATDLINTGTYELETAGMLGSWKDWFEIFPDTKKRAVHPSLAGAIEPPSARGLVYRSDLVPKDLQPLTYAKLADARFSGGKIGYNIRQYEHFAFLYPKWSDEEIIRYAKEVLVPQKPKLCNGYSACWEMLVRGEITASYLGVHQYFTRYVPKGVTNIAIGADYAPVDEGKPIALLKDAPHPNAAKLFLNWAASDGQEVFYKFRGRANPYDESNVIGEWLKKHGAKLFEHPETEREVRDKEIGAHILQLLGLPVPKR